MLKLHHYETYLNRIMLLRIIVTEVLPLYSNFSAAMADSAVSYLNFEISIINPYVYLGHGL